MAKPQEASDPLAEAAVLSAVMLSREALDEVRDELSPDDFFLGAHGVVFAAVLELDEQNEAIDVITIRAALEAQGKLRAVGGVAFLAELLDATPTLGHAIKHARIVRRLADLRRMRDKLRELLHRAHEPEVLGDVPGFLERCEAEIFALSGQRLERETASTLREVMSETREQLSPESTAVQRGAPTGLGQVDDMTLGLRPGELWYLAARPGVGKTALAMGIAAACAGSDAHAVVFSLEMDRQELGERMLSAASGVGLSHLQSRKLSAAHWSQITGSLEQLSHLPVVVDDASQLSPSRLRSRMRRHASRLRADYPRGKLGLVVVDYVQLMSGESTWRGLSRSDELERISRALKLLAKEFGVTVLALSQLNRGQTGRVDKRPNLSDLRGSGALEQDADKVVFIHRDEAEGEERGEAEIILAKGRNRATGSVSVRWQPWCVRFVDSEQSSLPYEQRGFGAQDPGWDYDEPELP